MLIGLIFSFFGIIFLWLIIRSRFQATRKINSKPKPTIKKMTLDDDSVRGDELAIWPFSAMPIMTRTEVIFFKKLQQAIPEYPIFVQVQLSRLITGNSRTESERNFWFNRICRQSIDYVIVDTDLQTTLVAIELDDWTHNSKARQKADDKKDKALNSAGIHILRFHAEHIPSVTKIRKEVLKIIGTH